MNRFARGVVLISFGFFLQNSSVFAAIYDRPAEELLNKASKKYLLDQLESISIFRTVDGVVFSEGIEDKAEPVHGPSLEINKAYSMSDEGDVNGVFNKLPWDKLLRYGVLNFARKNAASSNDLPTYWNHCMRANQQLRNFADILGYSIQDKYTNERKVELFHSLMDYYTLSVIPYLDNNYEKLEKIQFYYPGRRATKDLILKVNEKLLKAFDRIIADYKRLQDLPALGVLPKKKPLPPLPSSATPEELVTAAIAAGKKEAVKEEQDTKETQKRLLEELKQALGQKKPNPNP